MTAALRRDSRGLALASLPLLLFVVAPLGLLLARASAIPPGETFARPAVQEALWLSLGTSALSLALVLVFGSPLAYLLARRRFPGRDLVETLVDVPMVLPPAVAGLALLLAFGRRGPFGAVLADWGIDVAFTSAAVVLAQVFVAAPFYIRAARAGFASVDRELEEACLTLGAGPLGAFLRVTVPLALPSLVGGAVMAWARALGEFGATIMFAGNLAGRTRTMPLAIYTALESDLDAALGLALVLVAISFSVLLAMRALLARTLAAAE